VTKYDGEAKRVVYKMKFDSNRDIARYIARKLDETLPLIDFDVVTYCPTSPKRVRQRSYDHAKLIAKEFAGLRGLKWQKLLKKVDSSRQLGKSRVNRRKQAQKAYKYVGPKYRYKYLLIIDDVISTGATIEACTSMLRKNCATNVYAACFAIN